MRGKRALYFGSAVLVLLLVSACACMPKSPMVRMPEATAAIAVLVPTQGNTAKGIVRFMQVDDRVLIVASVEGLEPNTVHGFHIHEFGDFSSPDAKSAGGHYNPEGRKHGGLYDTERHAGDLGNLTANKEGKARLEVLVDNVSINGPLNPIVGRGIVVHAGEDDLKSQPTGNAGSRIAFGIIGIARGAE